MNSIPRIASSPSPSLKVLDQPTPSAGAPTIYQIRESIVACNLCPRLRDYCTRIGETRRRAYIDHTYWSRPVPGFGNPRARILILGLASKPRAVSRDDGLRLRNAWIASVVRCAPPGDKPTPQEIRNCAAHLTAEIAALKKVRVVVCLGKIAWDGFLAHLLLTGVIARRSDYRFAHGAEYILPNGLHLLGSYHPSLRNTNTGRLNRVMFTRIFVRARALAGLS